MFEQKEQKKTYKLLCFVEHEKEASIEVTKTQFAKDIK